MAETKYSVLMGVHAGANPEYFRTALESLINQTLPPDELVIVCDGPLTEELDKILDDIDKTHPGLLNAVRLEKNGGIGNAMMVGLPKCRNEYVLRADSDDISLPNRAEIELDTLINGSYDICSSTASLFFDNPDVIEGERRLPSEHEDIVKFAKTRSPFNQPSVVMKKSKAIEAGGYKPLVYGEDYDLWVRMLIAGCRGHNIEESLVLMRMSRDSYRRRKNKDYYESRKAIARYMRDQKFISRLGYLKIRFVYWAQYVSPSALNEWVYKHVLQKSRERERES